MQIENSPKSKNNSHMEYDEIDKHWSLSIFVISKYYQQ